MEKTYVITGKLANGKRFKPIYTSNLRYALSHNIYSGSLWQIVNGKRKRIKIWYN